MRQEALRFVNAGQFGDSKVALSILSFHTPVPSLSLLACETEAITTTKKENLVIE